MKTYYPQPTRQNIINDVRLALHEDIGSGDLSAELIEETATCHAILTCREDAVLCGTSWFDAVFKELNTTIQIHWSCKDGGRVGCDSAICTLEGSTRDILTGERTALNFIQTLSGTATKVWQYADQVRDLPVTLLDTRKTLPGLRRAQKYAVLCGGGQNHRMGLYDEILIKENHIIAMGSLPRAVALARQKHPNVPVVVEVENSKELAEALVAAPDRLLLDNFDFGALADAVQETAGRIPLEASGGVARNSLRTIAETGIDFISVGALTKDVRAVDFSLRI